jgi:secretion/DNA translocation related CpaE-like protein
VAFLPSAERWLIDRIADAACGPNRRGRVVGVVGGRGGAGASVLAAGLAVTAARQGMRSLLVDADPLGGGLDLVMGRESSAGVRWPDLVATAGRISAAALFDALPRVGEACVLSWDRGDVLAVPPAAIDAALDAGRRGSDLVVVDLPRSPDEAAVHALQGTDTVLLVVPAEVRACAAANRIATLIGPHCARIQCVVRGPAPAGLRSRDLVDVLRLPLAGILRPEPGLAAALERGEAPAERGRGPLAELCRQLLADLDRLPEVA